MKKLLFLSVIALLAQLLQAQIVTQTSILSVTNSALPTGIAIDLDGNVYTANAGNNTISKITASGSVTKIWAALAANANPASIVIDGNGNVYTANYGNNTVSKITALGIVTQAWATLASSAGPYSLAIDGIGNIYTANVSNSTVSKIDPLGTVTQAWATLTSSASPISIAIDANSNIYTANYNNNTVSKITPTGIVTEVWATLSSYASPISIAIDANNNVYTANSGNNTVSKISSLAIVTKTWTTLASNASPNAVGVDGTGNVYVANGQNNSVYKIYTTGEIMYQIPLANNASPSGIAVKSNGVIYTANQRNNTISKISFTQSPAITLIWASLEGAAYPVSIAIDGNNNVYTCNEGNSTISKISSTGVVTKAWATLSRSATLNGIAIDGTGNVYTIYRDSNWVSKITPEGIITEAWAVLPSAERNTCIAVDGTGNVYIANENSNTISKITPAGTITPAWVTLSSRAAPLSMVMDAANNIYTANYDNSTISKITPAKVVTQAWATLSSFAYPNSIAIDASGNLYTTNIGDSTVSKITPSGIVTPAWAKFSSSDSPSSIAIDASGNIYTDNSGNDTISRITPSGTITPAWASVAVNSNPLCIAIDANGNLYTANHDNNSVSKIMTGYIWQGNTSADWNDPSNWNLNAVPTNNATVIIPPTSNQPLINFGIPAFAKTIIIQNGANLFVPVNGSNILLTVSNGIIVNPGGSLIGCGSNISANVTLQQNILGQRGWRVFANPYSSTTNIATTSRSNGITIGTTLPLTGITDSRIYDNGSGNWLNVTGTTWAANNPYALFIRGLTSEVTGNNYTTDPSAFTYNVSGTLNGASTIVSPISTSNFMIVGNPYAAPISTRALTGLASTTYYTYQIAATGTPRIKSGSWVVSGSNSSINSTIPVLGVIAYQPSSTSAYNIYAASINTTPIPQTSLFETESHFQQMELVMESNGNYEDKLFIRQDPTATDNGTDKNEIQKLKNDVTNIYTITPDRLQMAIDARKNFATTIPLGVSTDKGEYNFRVNSNNFPSETIVYLKDNLLQTQTELQTGTSYKFSVTNDTASQGEQRFALAFAAKNTLFAAIDSSIMKFTATVMGNIIHNNTILIEIAGSNSPINILVRDMNGMILSNQAGINGSNKVQLGRVANGIYIVQISNSSSKITEKIIKL